MYTKKPLALLAVAALCLSALTGCGDKGSSSDGASSAQSGASSATAGSSSDNGAATPAADLARSGEVRDIKASELVSELKVGWNLGNSLDVFDGTGLSTETGWGNPKTTRQMIDGIKDKGFNLIRIPVTWGNHVDDSYTIDSEWLDRVQEVVNYAYDDGLYVIINSHHEEEWRIPDNEHIDESDKENAAIWEQIAKRFADYGDHLIFEGLNEPRVKGSPQEWNGGTEEGRRCVDRMNKTFVDTVRATGGNNEKRLLLITTYASSCLSAAVKDVEIIDDGHIGFSIHAYTPYAFTYNANEDWELFDWDGTRDGEISNMVYQLKKQLIDNGVPVIITEFGAVNKKGNDAEVAKWVKNYLTYTKAAGIPCVWWDNGYYLNGNELFGIYDRSSCSWFSQEVADALIENS